MMLDFNDAGNAAASPNAPPSLIDAVDRFRQEMWNAGFGEPEVIADGALHRFDLPEDKRGDKTGWYVFFPDGVPSASYGSWREGEARKWSACHSFTLTAAEQEALRRRAQEAKALREQARLREAEDAAALSLRLWEAAAPADPAHPYLARKGVGVFSLRQSEDQLLVPMLNEQGAIRGLQRIYADGSKRYVPGIAKNGLFCWIDGERGRGVYICEGYATGASLHMATGAAVIVAFDAGNLLAVARTAREKLPEAKIILAADNDQFTEKDGKPWNTGIIHAKKAAEAIGADVIWPEFRDLSTRPTDFNDLYALEGAQEVRNQASPVEAGPRLADWPLDLFMGAAPPRRWLVRDTLPLSCPCLLAAAGGTGKGMLELELALIVAGGNDDLMGGEWLGSQVDERGAAVLLLAEDSKDSVHERLQALDPDGWRREACGRRLTIVPLPNAGGPIMLVSKGLYGVFDTTPAYKELLRQLRRVENLKLVVIDPLASFAGIDINQDPQAGQYVQGVLAALAEETGACVLVAHHMGKSLRKAEKVSAEDAREAIRGTTALVDGVRCALAIWPASAERNKELAQAVQGRDEFFEAAVVKSNAPADGRIRCLARQVNGLLACVDGQVMAAKAREKDQLGVLCEAIAAAAAHGQPFSKTGGTGVYKRTEELPESLRSIGRRKLERMVQELLDSGRVVACTLKGSIAKWLDVPGGNFAEGIGTIEAGAAKTDCQEGAQPGNEEEGNYA